MNPQIFTLPSDTEISVEAALGNLRRVINMLGEESSFADSLVGDDWSAAIADLERVAELLGFLATTVGRQQGR